MMLLLSKTYASQWMLRSSISQEPFQTQAVHFVAKLVFSTSPTRPIAAPKSVHFESLHASKQLSPSPLTTEGAPKGGRGSGSARPKGAAGAKSARGLPEDAAAASGLGAERGRGPERSGAKRGLAGGGAKRATKSRGAAGGAKCAPWIEENPEEKSVRAARRETCAKKKQCLGRHVDALWCNCSTPHAIQKACNHSCLIRLISTMTTFLAVVQSKP